MSNINGSDGGGGGVSSGYSTNSNNLTEASTSTLTQNINNNNNINATNTNNTSFQSYVTGGGASTSSTNTNPNESLDQSSKLYKAYENNKLGSPYVNDEKLAYEVLSKAGPAYTYQRKDYLHDIGALQCKSSNSSTSSYQDFSNESNFKQQQNAGTYEFEEHANVIKIEPSKNLYSSSASTLINQDPDPITYRKPNNQNIVYKQQVNIRYLQPPTPPPPAPIIIREKQCAPQPALPPIIIRQTAPAPATPPPLTIREKAPTPPTISEPTIIERPIPGQPAPPRQVIIERVPAPPAKPRPIIYEKWLPYKSIKRPVIVQKVKQQPPAPPPKNIIIEYEKPKAVAIRQVIEEGIFRVDPATYQNSQQSMNGEIRFVDRITDLPIENSSILAELCLDSTSGYKRSDLTNENDVFTDSALQSALPNLLDPNFYNTAATFSSSNISDNNTNNNNNNNNNNNSNTSASNNNTNNSSSNNNNNNNNNCIYYNTVEYEEIKTSVSESVAAKIIAEAEAAGAISRNEKINYSK